MLNFKEDSLKYISIEDFGKDGRDIIIDCTFTDKLLENEKIGYNRVSLDSTWLEFANSSGSISVWQDVGQDLDSCGVVFYGGMVDIYTSPTEHEREIVIEFLKSIEECC